MKAYAKITITRDTLKTVLEGYLAGALKAPHELKEFTIHRTGSIEMSVAEKTPALPIEAGEQT